LLKQQLRCTAAHCVQSVTQVTAGATPGPVAVAVAGKPSSTASQLAKPGSWRAPTSAVACGRLGAGVVATVCGARAAGAASSALAAKIERSTVERSRIRFIVFLLGGGEERNIGGRPIRRAVASIE
jgi:hypothetical protein